MSGVRYSWMRWDNHRKVHSTGGYLRTIRVEYHYQEVSISMHKYYIDRRNMFSMSWNSPWVQRNTYTSLETKRCNGNTIPNSNLGWSVHLT